MFLLAELTINVISSGSYGVNGARLRFLLVPIASKLHGHRAVSDVLLKYHRVFNGVVTDLVGKVDDVSGVRELPQDVVAYVVAVLTGGTEQLITELCQRNVPTAVVAHSTHNSLAAAIEALPLLKREGRPVALFMLKNGVSKEVGVFLRAALAYRVLKGSKVVLVGDPSPWLVYSSRQLDALRKLLCLEVIKLSTDELLSKLEEVGDDAVEELSKYFMHAELAGVSEGDLRRALRVYVVLKSMLTQYGSKVLTIRCFDLMRVSTTACLALSILNDEGYVVGCEGDVPALTTMAALSSISDSPTFMGNVSWVDGSRVLVTHCTVPTKLVGRFKLKTHFESGVGVSIEGWPRRGEEVTLARLDALNKILRAGRAVVINEGPVTAYACRTQFLLGLKGSAEAIVSEPIGNHYVLAPGNWVKHLKYLAELLGLEFQELSK